MSDMARSSETPAGQRLDYTSRIVQAMARQDGEIARLSMALRALWEAIDPYDFVRVAPGERLVNGQNQHEVYFNTEPHDVLVITAKTTVIDAHEAAARLIGEA